MSDFKLDPYFSRITGLATCSCGAESYLSNERNFTHYRCLRCGQSYELSLSLIPVPDPPGRFATGDLKDEVKAMLWQGDRSSEEG